MIERTLLACSLLAAALSAEAAPPDVVRDLAPSGRLRAAINFGNPVLAQKDPATGAPRGVSAALAIELGRQLDVPVDFIPFTEAGQVTEANKEGAWDVAFLAIDPTRAAAIDYTAPYLFLEGIYLVPAASPLQRIEDVDREGIRVAVAVASAYDLFLTRTLTKAALVRTVKSAESFDLLAHNGADVLAGVRQPLLAYASAHPEVRIIPGRFMQISQAMAVPKGREAGSRFLRGFVEAMKASGFVAGALAASGQADATLAPPSPGP
jgi:polar amino acid transport system substrate-binding protein